MDPALWDLAFSWQPGGAFHQSTIQLKLSVLGKNPHHGYDLY